MTHTHSERAGPAEKFCTQSFSYKVSLITIPNLFYFSTFAQHCHVCQSIFNITLSSIFLNLGVLFSLVSAL